MPLSAPTQIDTPIQATGLAQLLRGGSWVAVVLWWLALKSLISRTLYLLNYGAEAATAPWLEPFAPTPLPALLVTTSLAALGAFAGEMIHRQALRAESPLGAAKRLRFWAAAIVCLLAAATPWLLGLCENWQVTQALSGDASWFGPSVWQPLWFAAFSGGAGAFYLAGLDDGSSSAGPSSPRWLRIDASGQRRLLLGLVLLATAMVGGWWFVQSQTAYDQFRLGFNDCGHFAQRVANTAAGRGWLVETPVLPSYWDHFNPGLAALVPLWWIWPHMSLFFLLQAIALAGCAPLVWRCALALGASPTAAAGWALAWLCQPVLGQMNLAYSYGWHPISLAIPLIWLSLIGTIERRWWLAILSALAASSFEEGVLVIIATTAATQWLVRVMAAWLSTRASVEPAAHTGSIDWHQRLHAALLPATPFAQRLSATAWFIVAACATVAFICVFQFSGLARFQTGRFQSLGDSPWEIIASPFMRPAAFWSLLLRGRNALFLTGLLVPCFLPCLIRGWVCLLPSVVPLVVLCMWNHLPAQSLAFHYASVLLPVIWLSALSGSLVMRTAWPAAWRLGSGTLPVVRFASWAALLTGVIASFSLGQLPWSQPTLLDVEAITYGVETTERRLSGATDQRFAAQQVAAIRKRATSVLATGRLACHLVGAEDLETVGQFMERQAALALLTPGKLPLLRYRTIILDRREGFQQSPAQTATIEAEALAAGFRMLEDQFDIVVLEQPN